MRPARCPSMMRTIASSTSAVGAPAATLSNTVSCAASNETPGNIATNVARLHPAGHWRTGRRALPWPFADRAAKDRPC